MTEEWKERLRKQHEASQEWKRAEEIGQSEAAKEFEKWVEEIAVPAFEELISEMEKYGWKGNIKNLGLSLHVWFEGGYSLKISQEGTSRYPSVETRQPLPDGKTLISPHVSIRSGGQDYGFSDISHEELLEWAVDIVTHFFRLM